VNQISPIAAAAPPRSAPEDRAQRFRRHLEQTLPTALALPPLDPAGLAAALGILAGAAEVLDATTLRIRRVGLPAPVRLRTTDLAWRCEAGHARGRGLVELGAWLTDRDLIEIACLLRLVLAPKKGFRHGR